MFINNHGILKSPSNLWLIVDASRGTNELEVGMGSILAQVDHKDNFQAISYAS
jgi:hypothetical protein